MRFFSHRVQPKSVAYTPGRECYTHLLFFQTISEQIGCHCQCQCHEKCFRNQEDMHHTHSSGTHNMTSKKVVWMLVLEIRIAVTYTGLGMEGTICFNSQKRKISPKRKFSAGRPCGHPAKNFGQALQILEKKQAFWHGHAARTSTKKTSVWKTSG